MILVFFNDINGTRDKEPYPKKRKPEKKQKGKGKQFTPPLLFHGNYRLAVVIKI